MSDIITKQMIASHIRDITLSKTIDLPRFSRMVDGKGKSLGSLEQRIAGIKKLVARLDDTFSEYKADVLTWLAYVESGEPLWSEVELDN